MSHAVVRGKPFASQIYLDNILDEVLQAGVSGAVGREGISLPQIMFHCLRKNPEDVFMINAASGEKITNVQILKQSISIARALIAKGTRGKNVMIAMRNHQNMVSVYFGVMFAGTVAFIMDPNNTLFELTHYLKLIEPCMVFCDEQHYDKMVAAAANVPELNFEVNKSNKDEALKELAAGFSGDADVFVIPDADVDCTVMMLPTSGSTGLPKATLITHRGLTVQLPITWCYHTQFPTPTDMCMLLTTPQWVTFTLIVTSCLVYRVPVLMSQKVPSVEWVKEMLVTYRPTWTFFGPAFAKSLVPTLTQDHLSSLNTLYLLGAPSSIELVVALKDKLSPTAMLGDVYGTTETQGYITMAVPGAPLKSTGEVINIFEYMLVGDNGKEVGLCQTGELYIKGLTTIKGYYKNHEVFEDSVSDGWLKTGDLFYIDECARLFYLERKNFSFKFLGCHVSPEEVELVIGSVPGVEECVVYPTENGPAALVVVQNTCHVSRDQIHKAVNDTLSGHKRLHGGVAFVSSLPHTHSGKIKRTACKALVQQMMSAGNLY